MGGAADARSRSRRRRAAKPDRIARDFYASALNSAEQVELAKASDVEGLDEEIAVLRMKLRKALADRPEDVALMLRGIDLLVKAVSARYRLSHDAEQDLSQSLANVVRGVGGMFIPEAFRDE